MPAKLTKHSDEVIRVKLSGTKPEFQELLQKTKSISGRRWNPDEKVWELPCSVEVLMKAVNILQPELDAELRGMIQGSQAKVADELTTKLPDDAELTHPLGSRLYPYQRAGIAWLTEHPHSILADDMGLGKTVQALAVVAEACAREAYDQDTLERPRLVVCPNSLKANWKREIGQWLGEAVPVIALDGKNPAARRKQLDAIKDRPSTWVIVNWEKLRLMPELEAVEWFAVIGDEAHRAKNRKAKQTQALWRLRAPIQLALTGTPIMNSPDELWPILRWLRPETYTSYWRFFYEYVDSYEVNYGNRRSRVITGVRNPDALRFELSDKLVRRTKDRVLDLPEKTRQTIPVELRPKQRKLYEQAEKDVLLEIQKAVDSAETEAERRELAAAIEAGDPQKLQLMIDGGAARVTRLRQIASSPALLDGEDESGKYDAVQEIAADAPHKQLVVFTWFKGAAELLANRLRKDGRRAEPFTGDTSPDERDELVRRFQDGDLDILVCTLATAGVGLTLTAADTCIFVERDWTPAINQQAEDRLHRIGQTNHVTVIILEATGTVDTGKIAPTNRLKEVIIGSVIGS